MRLALLNLGAHWTPAIRAAAGTRPLRSASFGSTATLSAQHEDHYKALGVSRTATKKEIKDKFYELSRKYHPDAPSTTSDSIESRISRFQHISQSYAVLSDDVARRSYDQTIRSSSHHHNHPTYTRAESHHYPSSSFAAWSATHQNPSDNTARRERANYAWQHPTSRKQAPGASAAEAASARNDPFRNSGREQAVGGLNDHFDTFARREELGRQRARTAGRSGRSGFTKGTEGFGAKAEEESRLINDSSAIRSGQVFLAFAGAFAVASMFSRGRSKEPQRKR